MAHKLTAAGVTNAAVYPNGRPRPEAFQPVAAGTGPLQCVFFSQIEPEKGVDRILEASVQLPDMMFLVYSGLSW